MCTVNVALCNFFFSKGSALNDHVANYVNRNNFRRLWPEITIDLLLSFVTYHSAPVIREISLMGGFLRLREFLPPEKCTSTFGGGRGSGATDLKSRHLIVVALVAPSLHVTFRELYLSKMCEKMSMSMKFFSVYFNGRLGHASFSTQQIRAAVVYLSAKYPKSYFTAIACDKHADILLNYLGDTGAACKFESAVLLAPTCRFGVEKINGRKPNVAGLEAKVRSGKLRKISLQEVNTINFENGPGANEYISDSLENLSNSSRMQQQQTPKNSLGNILSAFLPDNVDDVSIPVLWIPEQTAEGSIAPVELFEESINFMLLRLDATVRCRLDLWQNALQFGIAVHSFFHSENRDNQRKKPMERIRRK